MKNTIRHLLVAAAAIFTLGAFTNSAAAQGFDSAQARERQMQGYRDRLNVKADEDWKKLEPLITKVTEAQRDARMGLGAFGRRGGGGGGGGSDQPARNRGQSNPETEALQKAIEDKAPADEIKAKLAKVREARKAREAALEKVQADFQKALSPKQEAAAVLAGLLK